MILSKGKLYDSEEQDIILENLETDINKTRMTKALSVAKVITAIDKLCKAIANGEFDNEISQLNIDSIENYIETAAMTLKSEKIQALHLSLEQGIFHETCVITLLLAIKISSESFSTFQES